MQTSKKMAPMFEADGARNQRILTDENDPGLITSLSEWDSHDAMHASSEKYGDQFNSEAGTEGLEWETHIWREIS